MKRPSSAGLKLSSLTIALTCLLSIPAYSAAHGSVDGIPLRTDPPNNRTSTSFAPPEEDKTPTRHTSITLKNEEMEGHKRLMDTLDFTNNAYSTMVNNITTSKYLQNHHLSAAATFPQRMFRKLNKNPWRPAPFMAVPEKDLACYYGIPAYREPMDYDPDTAPVQISADNVSGNIESTISYDGNVTISQGDKSLKADKVSYDRKTSTLRSEGNLIFQSPEVTITSRQHVEGDIEKRIATVYDANFQLNGAVARGRSDKITLNNKEKSSTVENLSFTTCPAGDSSWYIKSDSITIKQDEYFGEARGNTLYIKDVPVLYLPYANFPISNRRKSGLLYPEFSLSSDNGFDYRQPIYFNLAPNYDYTFTPRIMTKRGLLLSNEFRYMPWRNTLGSLTVDYIHEDDNWIQASDFDSRERYMLRWQHETSFYDKDLVLNVDYQTVRHGDYDYVNDIGIEDAEITDDHLLQSFKASYDQLNWHFNLEFRDYQRMLPDNAVHSRLFAVLPQITANWYETFGSTTFDFNGEVTRFASSSEDGKGSFTTSRLHFEPEIQYQLFNSRGTTATARVRGFFTSYNQDSLERMPDYYTENMGFEKLTHHKNRALYLMQMNAKTTLERRILDLRHTQTLEPEIQYQYIPYQDQNDIALYDTTDRMSDYYTNFSFRRFTGRDRISDLNNLTVGLTSRILDAHDREQMRFGIAQTYSFVPSRVTLHPNDTRNLYPRSPLSIYFNAHPAQNWTTHASFSYSTESNNVSSWNAMTEYRNESGFMTQISYRFIDHGNRTLNDEVIDLSQLGLVTSIPLNKNLQLTAAAYRDLQQGKNIDTRVTLRYEECCWSVAFVYEHYKKTNWDTWSKENDHMLGIEFEFKGAGAIRISGQSKTGRETDTHLLDYFNPTNLNH